MTPEDIRILTLHNDALLLLKQKKDDESIITQLMKRGIDRHYAEIVLENVKNDMHDRKQLNRHIFMGSFIFLAGLAMTITSYVTTFSGDFFVFAGLIVTGIIVIIRGVITFKK